MRLAVVGHVEWAEIFQVEHLPASGEVQEASRLLVEVAGAGATAARQLAKLAGRATFFTVLADDELGRRAVRELRGEGVRVRTGFRQGASQRRALVHVDRSGERTITVFGEKLCPSGDGPLPWNELERADGACFICGDEAALRAARGARVLVATARWLPVLKRASVRLDALVGSAGDPAEAYQLGDLSPPPRLVVTTGGAAGGWYSVDGGPERPYPPVPVDGGELDSYGCGDSFVAGLTFALARGDEAAGAVAFAARCGAACFSSLGLVGQLRLVSDSDGATALSPGDRA